MAEQFARAARRRRHGLGKRLDREGGQRVDGRDGNIVVLGRQSLAESPESVVQAAAALAALPGVGS